jgi:lipid-binding SYLF domain-containing protein
MNKKIAKITSRFSSVFFLLGIMSLVFFPGLTANAFADEAKELNAEANQTLKTFEANVKDAKEVIHRAKGLLILPSVKKGALIIGGEYGRGVLRIGGKTADYYSMISGSVGFQIGGEARDIIIAFMTDDALKKFRDSKGWEAGVDGNVALVKMGGGESAISAMADEPIVAFVFDVKGLIADLSLKGAKFSKLSM